MSENELRRNVPLHGALHPAVYAMMAGAALWMVVVSWLIFGGDPYNALQMAVVTGFALAFLVTPLVLNRLSRARRAPIGTRFREWLDHDFETNTGVVHSREATTMILVAPLAGAIGITAIGFVAWLAATGAL